jgi:hypothetical protein
VASFTHNLINRHGHYGSDPPKSAFYYGSGIIATKL